MKKIKILFIAGLCLMMTACGNQASNNITDTADQSDTSEKEIAETADQEDASDNEVAETVDQGDVSDEEIAQTVDSYTKEDEVYTQIHWGFSYKASKFDGYKMIWMEPADEDNDRDVTFTFKVSKGNAKVVQIDENNNVTTVIECTPDQEQNEVTQAVSLKTGKNRFKVVGSECEDLELEMKFDKTDYHKKKDSE